MIEQTEPPADAPVVTDELLVEVRADATVHHVEPGSTVRLDTIDTRGTPAWDGDKEQGKIVVAALNRELEALQEQMYAEGRRRLLVVLQATDTAGKDSTIKHVFDGLNPQGVKVASFKKPTAEELAHDYLWRVHAEVPADGQITIFNRSHYEDVLVVRVHDLVEESQWSRRYDHIVAFEQMLADEGTDIIKIFLHISKDEQAERLQERLDTPRKNWKFAAADLDERKRWDDYQTAFTDAIERTATADAPWYIVPADRKWYRNLVIGAILVERMRSWGMDWPEAEAGLSDITIV